MALFAENSLNIIADALTFVKPYSSFIFISCQKFTVIGILRRNIFISEKQAHFPAFIFFEFIMNNLPYVTA